MVIPSGMRVVELVVIPKGVHGSGGQVVEAVVEPDVECPSSSPGVLIKQGGVNGGLQLPKMYWSVQLQTLAGQEALLSTQIQANHPKQARFRFVGPELILLLALPSHLMPYDFRGTRNSNSRQQSSIANDILGAF